MINDNLRPEKFLWGCFRTGVQLPSSPPDGRYTSTIPKVLTVMPGGLFGVVATLEDYDAEQRALSHKATYAEIKAWVSAEYHEAVTNLDNPVHGSGADSSRMNTRGGRRPVSITSRSPGSIRRTWSSRRSGTLA